MTADLREAMALAPWGPVTVKKEEEEEEGFLGQASGQQVHSEDIKAGAPGEDPREGLDGAEQEEKVNNGLGGMREETEGSPGLSERPLSLCCHTWSLVSQLELWPLDFWNIKEHSFLMDVASSTF